MNPTLIATLVLSGLVPSSQQNTDMQALVFDYLTSRIYRELPDGTIEELRGMPSVRANRPLRVKVLNANTFKYKVEIKAKEQSLFTSIPEALGPLLAVPPGRELVGFDGDSRSVLEGGRSGVRALESGKALAAEISEVETLTKSTNDLVDAIESLTELDDELKSIAASAMDPEPDPLKDPREPSMKRMEEIREKVAELVDSVLRPIRAQDQSFSSLNVDSPSIPRFARTALSAARAKHSELRTSVSDLRLEFGKATKEVAVRSRGASAEEEADLAALEKAVERFVRSSEDTLDRTNERLSAIEAGRGALDKEMERSQRMYNRLMNENIYLSSSHPQTPQADLVTFSISVTPLVEDGQQPSDLGSGLLNWHAEDTSLERGGVAAQDPPSGSQVNLDVKVVGRLKIDYSAGIFFSTVTDENYRLEDAVGGKVIRSGASDRFEQRFGALVHVYRTSSARIVPALSFGLATGTASPTFMVGVSLLGGEAQRFGLTLGIVGAKVSRLNGYKVGDVVPDDADITTKVTRTGFFMGLTFNLR